MQAGPKQIALVSAEGRNFAERVAKHLKRNSGQNSNFNVDKKSKLSVNNIRTQG
jgi:hypothetical protein